MKTAATFKLLIVAVILLVSASCSKPATPKEWIADGAKSEAYGIRAIRNFGEPQASVLLGGQGWIAADLVQNGRFTPTSPTGNFRVISYLGVPPNNGQMWEFHLYDDGHLTDQDGNPWKPK